MKIAIACDHGGWYSKERIKNHLQSMGHEVLDFGTDSVESCDYPDYALPAAEAVANGECERGVVVCSTGIGVSIVANKVPGIRCALCHSYNDAYYARAHNNANMLALGEKVVGYGYVLEIVDTFLNAKFEGDRHQRRVDKITEIEKKYSK